VETESRAVAGVVSHVSGGGKRRLIEEGAAVAIGEGGTTFRRRSYDRFNASSR